MESAKLNLSSLKDKISSKLTSGAAKKEKKSGSKKTGSQESSKSSDKRDKKSKDKKTDKKAPKNREVTEDENEDEDKVLEREALALGATKEDLALVNGLNEDQSDEEFADAGTDKNLNSELASFMKGLGLSGEVDVVEDDDVSELEEDIPDLVEDEASQENEEEEDEEEEEQEAEQPAIPAKSALPTAEAEVGELIKPKSYKIDDVRSVKSAKLKIENRVDWFNIEVEQTEPEKLDRFALERLNDKAKEIIDNENKTYLQEFSSDNSQKKFLSQILADGTLNDKISALTLLVQEAPLHNIKPFETLLNYCEKKSRTAALQAVNAMKDLFINSLLPDRKLVAFNKAPLTQTASDSKLAIAYYEDFLKKSYFKFIQVLEYLSHDPILHVRMTVLSHIFDLLTAKPEQEVNLLRLGVNKLGDIDNKVAAKTSYQILQLEQAHPAMKKIVVDSVTDMVLQKQSEYHSQYYTILTLNQTILSKNEIDLANSLVKTYFSLFEKLLVESDPALKDKKEDKTMGQSERGRKNNRRQFKKGKKGGKSEKVQEKTEEEVIEERSSKMFSAILTGLNRALPYSDLPSDIYMKHMETLYKITHSTNFNTSVQALVLVYHIISEQDLESDRYYRTLYESLMDPRLVNSSKQGIYLNLLFKSLKHDIHNMPRILAFVKRILQVSSHWVNVAVITGMMFLLMELSKTYPQIVELMEAVKDRPDFPTDEINDSEKEVKNEVEKEKEYDPKKRNPSYANAENSCLWEMNHFVSHYHPTVSIYADSFLTGKPQPKPDLGLYTLAHFLDRFVYKNAKAKGTTKGSSIMQPLGGGHTGSLLMKATNMKSNEVPVNTVNWLAKKAEEVRPDERFFHQYFTGDTSKIRNKRAQAKLEGDDEEDDEEKLAMHDDEVWEALVKSQPDVEGDDLSDEGGFSDFDEADFGDMSDDDDDADADADTAALAEAFGEDDDISEGELAAFDEAEFETNNASDDENLNSDESAVEDDADEDEDEDVFGVNDEDEYDSDEAVAEESSKKRSRDDTAKKSKKPKLSSLPTFADASDYAKYLESDEE
ncbi:hypothetical protein FT663_01083 [Candidozyma haemuli var. vulneris]|uniref:CCAAT-binding factor domain-containing protein n=1 Tax=Candidozyma haemuli TaxID=45357 RepID=A0A2V1AVB1_9ASCO|nr:hypothetical protein CXQ85_000446 [[Candida] haemuloni]KAF3986097.1 hypothetical protein FT662_04754 [[Candida] haemuloni var. vulneris]KAF3994853.1 hypothetical protein FT663_01083 [[Candida] haemuloni var. vulneris]PVH21466.1 hypothetical protein CXQ85_000446 [[Candida] haemuloni]